jgi:hypothetical protein
MGFSGSFTMLWLTTTVPEFARMRPDMGGVRGMAVIPGVSGGIV